jgi:hypothetical protein
MSYGSEVEVSFVNQRMYLTLPEFVWKARDAQHFRMMLADWIREQMLSPDLYMVNPYHMKEAELAFIRTRKGEDRIKPEEVRFWELEG